ncbi:unnamed protein product [Haemonchus placei]|uniref:Uncharacterized protein n=1 Tax=Haemonchus placei TaxID=6290 RepID=A0A0N4XAP2_HAEPC|nr:unnamed protein product [Haemonchus placei]
MVDLKQHLDLLDYFGGLAVCCAFFSIIFVISNTCIRLCCISKEEKLPSTPFSVGLALSRIQFAQLLAEPNCKAQLLRHFSWAASCSRICLRLL